MIVGEDNLRGIKTWYNSEFILANFRILVYPRSIQADEFVSKDEKSMDGNIEYLSDVPALELSSSQIRTLIKQQKSIKYMVPEVVERMIKEMGFYR